jgi:hypothetical protein
MKSLVAFGKVAQEGGNESPDFVEIDHKFIPTLVKVLTRL